MNWIIRSYALFVCLWFVTYLFFQDAWWLLVVLDKFAEYFVLASVPLFLLSLITRKTLTIMLALCALLVCGYFYAPLLVPKNNMLANPAVTPLRVATYNIWNHSTDLQRVASLAMASQADIIAVQELTDEQRATFVELMSVAYPHYYVSQPIYGGTTALFSKLALNNIQELDFNIDRPAVLADVNYEGVVVTVVSAHLNPSFWAYHDQPLLDIPGNYHQYIKDQNTQARRIIDAVKARVSSSAAIVACDCNSQETASTNRLLKTYFKDAFRSVGFQLGEPIESNLKYERKLTHIDYVWFVGDLSPSAVYRARASAGSDHAPVMADFYLNSP